MIEFSIVSPCPNSDLPQIWKWLQFFAKETLDEKAPKSLEEFLLKENFDRHNGGKTFAVALDGHLVGGIWYEAVGDGMAVGHLVFDPGHTLSTSGKMQAVRQTLKEAGFRKIIWTFFADNRAFRVFLKRLGAEEEGLFRKQVRREGELVDQAFMASFPEAK